MSDPFFHTALKPGMIVKLSQRFIDDIVSLCVAARTNSLETSSRAKSKRFRIVRIWSDSDGSKVTLSVTEMDSFGAAADKPEMFFDYDVEPADGND